MWLVATTLDSTHLEDRASVQRSQHIFFKRPDVADHMVSDTAAQLYCRSTKAAIDTMSTNARGCAPIKLYLQKPGSGQIWPVGLVCRPLT